MNDNILSPTNAAWQYVQSRLSVYLFVLFRLRLLNVLTYELHF